MLVGTVDHLWQSLQFSGAACALAWLAHGNAAIVRLWLYRLAALKFFVPFHLFFAIGHWYGFPRRFSGDPPPVEVVAAVAHATPLFAPARSLAFGTVTCALLLLLGLAASVAILGWITRRKRHEEVHVYAERGRLDHDPDDRQP